MNARSCGPTGIIATVNRTDRPESWDERAVITTFLDYARATVRVKCEGLSDANARLRSLPGSPDMTVAGIVGHLRWVERAWFEGMLLGDDEEDRRIDAEPEAGMRPADDVPIAELLDRYDAQALRYRELVAGLDLDAESKGLMGNGKPVTLRWILFHLIEETARHNGHLDILRELADGVTGT